MLSCAITSQTPPMLASLFVMLVVGGSVLVAQGATLIVVLILARRSVMWQLIPLLAFGAGALILLLARSVGMAYTMVAANNYGDGKLFCLYVQELRSNAALALGVAALMLVLVLFALFRAVGRARMDRAAQAAQAPMA